MLESLKKIDLAGFMTACWQVKFKREREQYVARSPFRNESSASFYVTRKQDGHWVFYDHGSGDSGTIIDAVMAYEGITDVGQGIKKAKELVAETGLLLANEPKIQDVTAKMTPESLHKQLIGNEPEPVRTYLLGRGIAADLVDELINHRIALLNRVQKTDYCCLALHDADGQLVGLFNRKIKGPSHREKFLIGEQHAFCLDWEGVRQASRVIICEGIIDCLSMLTLDRAACVLGLPGVNFNLRRLGPLAPGALLIEAFDRDEAGRAAAKRLIHQFPEHRVEHFDHQGACDVNELLCSEKKDLAEQKLSLQSRVEIAMSNNSSRKAAQQYGVHHSRVCAIRKDAAKILEQVWEQRRPGRKAEAAPSEEHESLQRRFQEMKHEYELLQMRSEWQKLELKMAKDREVEAGRLKKKRRRK